MKKIIGYTLGLFLCFSIAASANVSTIAAPGHTIVKCGDGKDGKKDCCKDKKSSSKSCSKDEKAKCDQSGKKMDCCKGKQEAKK